MEFKNTKKTVEIRMFWEIFLMLCFEVAIPTNAIE